MFRSLITIFLFLVIYSCRNNDKGELEGKYLITPDNLYIYDKYNTKKDIFTTDTKIIIFINGNCGSCIHSLLKLDTLIKSYDQISDIAFNIYIDTHNIDVFDKLMGEKIKLKYPLIIDIYRKFMKENKLEKIPYNSFILVHENYCVYEGDILNDLKAKSEFDKHLYKLLK